jgi:hypothetical protein
MGASVKLREVTISFFVMFVRTEQLGSHWTDFHEILYLRIFRKCVQKIRFSIKSVKKNGYFKRRPMHIYENTLNSSENEKRVRQKSSRK